MGDSLCLETDKPDTPWDYALLAVAVLASVPFIVANIVVFMHRKRRYFVAQGGALLIITSSLAGLIWITATFVTHMHFFRKHGVLLLCPLWSFWLQLTFGFWLWLASQALRLLHLLYLCQAASDSSAASTRSCKRRMLLWALLLWTPGLVFTIVATVTRASQLTGDNDCPNCTLQGVWNLCAFIILPSIYFAILSILLIHANRIKDYVMVTERSYTCEYSLIMALVIYLSYGAAILAKSQYRIAGRCFLTFCVCFVVFINFWVRLGWPVYLCLFRGKSEMDSFEEELRSCGAECLDQLSLAGDTSRYTRRFPSARRLGDWIVRAIDATMNDVSECKEMINQLEQKKAALSGKLKQLELSTSPKFLSSGSVNAL